MDQPFYSISSEFSILLFVLLILSLAFSVYLIISILRLRKEQLGHISELKNSVNQSNSLDPAPTSKEKEISDKKIQDLNDQLKSKTIELAKIAKEHEEQTQLLTTLKAKCNEMLKNPATISRLSNEIHGMLETIEYSQDSTFEIQLDELHEDFAKNLIERFPELTTHDIRLATYIRIGLNSKEISELLNIKPSSVYISRSRLRKKIDLDTDTDLHSFLNTI